MTSDQIDGIQNMMLMTKLSEGAEVCSFEVNGERQRYVVLSGMPLSYRQFVLIITLMIRGAGQMQYDKMLWDQIYELWGKVDYKYPQYQNGRDHHTTFMRNKIFDVVKRYCGAENEMVDFKPLMSEVYQRFLDTEA
jgi:hypothetical protein